MKAIFLRGDWPWLSQRLQSMDWAFVRGTAIVSAGMLIARLLGLGFSLVLARAFSPHDFGYIQYVLAVGSVLAVVIHPFGQHVIARFISNHLDGHILLNEASTSGIPNVQIANHASDSAPVLTTDNRLVLTLNNCWFLFAALFILTLAVCAGFVLLSDNLGYELVVVVFGIALFYAYWGVSRGYMRSGLLTAAYLGSNVVQLIVVSFLIWFLEIRSSALALSIYGLSYVPTIFVLQKKYPLPLHFEWRLSAIRWPIVAKVARFSLPVTLSHAAFMLFVATDLLFLNRLVDPGAVGQYALAKTLSTAFAFIPMGISTLLMPQIASRRSKDHRSLLFASVSASLLINLLFLVGYWILVEWFVSTFFGPEYLTTIALYIVLALSAMMLGIQSIVASVYVGNDQPEVETVGRGLAVLFLFLGCWLLIPSLGAMGAAVSVLAGSIAALALYIGHGYLQHRSLDVG